MLTLLPRHRVDPQLRADVSAALAEVSVVQQRSTITGYDRDAFGGWASAGSCTTRQVVLVDYFGGRPCHPAGTAVVDFYTGEDLRAADADIDHIYPLAAAWDFGACWWTAAERARFANDPANLVPTDSAVNRKKSDLTLAQWLPPYQPHRCAYVARYVGVARAYGLPLSVADWQAAASACGIDGG
ncbi:HNH endonuclease family protein [Corynebacterium sp. TAE3-ERU12]|uniref:HNH endonuclease family protein n=1 Tax=Corynebacterium sp. TAE3-ERU12 TaxID=2849491 RepID=UPI001C48A545|nr:HNH endonuclease family protein [Corynebacterium sp. TAE3-ERU12]MBV7295084.1 HNH endonuclease family protein [Corynebacterium sp. TAE3-ERU12]